MRVERLLLRGAQPADIVRWTNTDPALTLGIEVPALQVGDRAALLGFTGTTLTRTLVDGSLFAR